MNADVDPSAPRPTSAGTPTAHLEGAVPMLTVRGGTPTPEELAALTVALALVGELAQPPVPPAVGPLRARRPAPRPARRPAPRPPAPQYSLHHDAPSHPKDPR